MRSNYADPYAGNILISHLGPILSPAETMGGMRALPQFPPDVEDIPSHIRLHYLMRLKDFHEPRQVDMELQCSIDLMIRRGYDQHNPIQPRTWAKIAGEPLPILGLQRSFPTFENSDRAAAVVGAPGTGKTEGILRSLSISYQHQVFIHASFPNLVGPHAQLVWLSINVPGSGKAVDLVWRLMQEWDDAMARRDPNYVRRFTDPYERVKLYPQRYLHEWLQVARSHFLGILHLDEIQNLFKIASIERRKAAKKTDRVLELSLVEDATLKWILEFINTSGIPLIVSGTPDGISALTTRQATAQRLVVGGFHTYRPFSSAQDPLFVRFVKAISEYQLVKRKIDYKSVLDLIFSLTAGIPRLIVALWIAAHRIAFRRGTMEGDDLRSSDFIIAGTELLAPVQAAVQALLSRQPDAMRKYEDLLPGEDFWDSFWSSNQQEPDP